MNEREQLRHAKDLAQWAARRAARLAPRIVGMSDEAWDRTYYLVLSLAEHRDRRRRGIDDGVPILPIVDRI